MTATSMVPKEKDPSPVKPTTGIVEEERQTIRVFMGDVEFKIEAYQYMGEPALCIEIPEGYGCVLPTIRYAVFAKEKRP